MIISKVMFHMHPSLQNPELVLTLDFKCAITWHCPSASKNKYLSSQISLDS